MSELDLIVRQLNEISASLKDIHVRLDRLEGKTNDIHHYVPFVGWLETVGKTLSRVPGFRSFLRGSPGQTLLFERGENDV